MTTKKKPTTPKVSTKRDPNKSHPVLNKDGTMAYHQCYEDAPKVDHWEADSGTVMYNGTKVFFNWHGIISLWNRSVITENRMEFFDGHLRMVVGMSVKDFDKAIYNGKKVKISIPEIISLNGKRVEYTISRTFFGEHETVAGLRAREAKQKREDKLELERWRKLSLWGKVKESKEVIGGAIAFAGFLLVGVWCAYKAITGS